LFQEGWGAALGYPGIVLDDRGDTIHGFAFSSDELPAHWDRLERVRGRGLRARRRTVELEDGNRVRRLASTRSAERPSCKARPAHVE
jgi:hypothetical protein